MSDKVKVIDKDGSVQEVDAPVVDKTAVDVAVSAMLPIMKAHGEAVAQSMRDVMEEGLEKVAKSIESNTPLNQEAYDKRKGFADVPGELAAPGEVSAEDKSNLTSHFVLSYAKNFGDMDRVKSDLLACKDRKVVAATEKLLTAGESGKMGLLIPEFVRDNIKMLRDDSVVIRRMANQKMTIKGNATLPKELSRASAYYQGENEDLKISDFGIGQDRISPKKLTCLVAVTNELLKDSSTDISSIVNMQMRRAYALKEGQAFLNGAGTNYSPKGILNQVTQKADATGVTIQNVFNDVINAEVAIRSKNHTMDSAAWTFNSHRWGALMKLLANDSSVNVFAAELLAGRFFGREYFETNQIQEDGLTGSDMALLIRDYMLVVDSEDFEISASKDASFKDEGGNLISAFSRDLTAWRLIHRSDVHYEYPEAAFIITNAKYEA